MSSQPPAEMPPTEPPPTGEDVVGLVDGEATTALTARVDRAPGDSVATEQEDAAARLGSPTAQPSATPDSPAGAVPHRGRLGRLRESLTTSREQLDAEDERRERLTDTTAIDAARARENATFGGVLTAVTYPAAGASPLLRARLFDGTGTLELVFLGRRTVPGIDPGRRLRASGTPTDEGNGLVLYNPALDLVAATGAGDE